MEEIACIITKKFSEIDWSTTPSWISAVATLSLAIIAGKGVHAWKKEHKGKLKLDSAREILKLVHQIQGRLNLEPVAYKGDKRIEPSEFIKNYPNEFFETVQSKAKKEWEIVDPLISDLYAEGIGSRRLLGKTITENIGVMVSYLRALNPNRESTYKLSPEEMNGEELSAEQFSERVTKNAVLKLPAMIVCLEDELSKSIE